MDIRFYSPKEEGTADIYHKRERKRDWSYLMCCISAFLADRIRFVLDEAATHYLAFVVV